MKTVHFLLAMLTSLLLATDALAQQQQQSQAIPAPPPPPPPPQQKLPMNASVTPNGVSIPVGDSKNVTIEVNKLPHPQPGEKGATISGAVKF
jgi:hypothetical protein